MNLGDMSFTVSGGTIDRSFGERAGDILNVKDFGALGNGIHDDGPAIQAAFNQAFGTAGAPHGTANPHLNKPVRIPAGLYLTNQELYCTELQGAWIFGDGRDVTTIRYVGPADGGGLIGARSCLIVQYMRSCLFEDFTVECESPLLADVLVAFFSSQGIGSLAGNGGNHNIFRNVGFRNALDGCLIAPNASGLGSEYAFYNCLVENCKWGYRIANNFNALDYFWMGGQMKDCEEGISNHVGTINFCGGVEFINNSVADVLSSPGVGPLMVGNISNSEHHVIFGGPGYMIGTRHTGTGRFIDMGGAGTSCIAQACNSDGVIRGNIGGRLYLRGSKMENPDLYDNFSGTKVEDNI